MYIAKFEHHSIASGGYHSVRSLTVLVLISVIVTSVILISVTVISIILISVIVTSVMLIS